MGARLAAQHAIEIGSGHVRTALIEVVAGLAFGRDLLAGVDVSLGQFRAPVDRQFDRRGLAAAARFRGGRDRIAGLGRRMVLK
jgi:hypothetical protein